jgi:hypothetical protein
MERTADDATFIALSRQDPEQFTEEAILQESVVTGPGIRP